MKRYRTLYYLGLAVIFTALGYPLPAHAITTFSGRNAAIAVNEQLDTTTYTWSISRHGTSRLMTTGNIHSIDWSPQGKQFAFIRQLPNGNGRIEIIDAVSRAQTLSTTNPLAHEHSLQWSPDGRRIAFIREYASPQAHYSAVITSDLRGREVNITGWQQHMTHHALSWAPDGTRLVYETRQAGQLPTLVIQVIGGTTQKLTTLSDTVDSQVAWSPNGKKILYRDSSSETYTIWPDGSHRTVISDGDSALASWSPDGNQIVFIEDVVPSALSISQRDGSISYLSLPADFKDQIIALTWSPDGSYIALSTSHTLATLHIQSGTYHVWQEFQHPLTGIDWQSRP